MEVSLSKRKIIFGSIRTIHSVTALNVVAQTTILRDNPGMATNETHTIAGQTFSLGRTVTDSYDYYWGRNLLGTFHDAGGIGGLLAYTRNGALRIPIYDHIGNVVVVVDDSGTTIATYEYDPFGNIVAKSGPETDEDPFRFSTKYFDAETGLHYYGYRFYASTLGRWLNRDPKEEYDSENLYSFVQNSPQTHVDPLGLSTYCSCFKIKTFEAVYVQNSLNFQSGRYKFVPLSTNPNRSRVVSKTTKGRYFCDWLSFIRIEIVPEKGEKALFNDDVYANNAICRVRTGYSIRTNFGRLRPEYRYWPVVHFQSDERDISSSHTLWNTGTSMTGAGAVRTATTYLLYKYAPGFTLELTIKPTGINASNDDILLLPIEVIQ